MAAFTLYGFGESGNSYKAALMLDLCGLDWQCRPVAYAEGETRGEEFRREVNPMGEAPVLVHEAEAGRVTLSQSGVILDYLAELTGRFGPQSPEERRDILRWILFDNHKFTSYFATLRFLVGLQGGPETPVTEWLRGRVRASWSVVDRHLAEAPFLVGARPTIADISLAGYVFYEEPTGLEPDEFPAIGAWRERIRALPGWRHPYQVMPRTFAAKP